MSKNSLIRNTAIYALGDIIPKALSLLVFPVLTTYLSPSDYGIVNYVNTIVFLFSTIGLLCLNTYYLVYYFKVGGEQEQRKLLGTLSLFVIGLNVLLSLLFFGLGALVPGLFSSKIDFFPYIALGIGINFFNILSILPSALFRVQERPLPLTILNVVKGALTMGLTVLLVVGYQFSALGVLWSAFIVSALFGLIFAGITWHHISWGIDWGRIKQALQFSLPLLPGSLAYYFLSMSDRLFIERYLDLTQLGIYSTASTLAMILNIITYGAYKAFEPHFFKIYGTEGFKARFVAVQHIYLLVVLVGAMGLSMFGREFFALFASAGYQGVYYYVPLIEIGVVFSSMSMLYGTIVVAREKTKLNSMVTIIGGSVSVVINLVLLPHIGIVASCIASSVAFGSMMVGSAYFARLGISFVRPAAAFLLAVVSVWFSVYVMKLESMWLSIGVKAGVLLCVAFLIMRIFGLTVRKLVLTLRDK